MTDTAAVVVCVKEHVCEAFSDDPIPVGSRWDADSPVVKAAPRHFKAEK